MKYHIGDIFQLRNKLIQKGEKVILTVPTNVGWKKDGSNVQGAGIAKQLKENFKNKNYALEYGLICHYYHEIDQYEDKSMCYAVISDDLQILFFATKPLNEEKPYLSWQQNSTIEQIKASMKEFKSFIDYQEELILFPLVGSGNGGLDKNMIQEYLIKELKDYNNIILCDLNLSKDMLELYSIEKLEI